VTLAPQSDIVFALISAFYGKVLRDTHPSQAANSVISIVIVGTPLVARSLN
jgi:hypothetical protein